MKRETTRNDDVEQDEVVRKMKRKKGVADGSRFTDPTEAKRDRQADTAIAP